MPKQCQCEIYVEMFVRLQIHNMRQQLLYSSQILQPPIETRVKSEAHETITPVIPSQGEEVQYKERMSSSKAGKNNNQHL